MDNEDLLKRLSNLGEKIEIKVSQLIEINTIIAEQAEEIAKLKTEIEQLYKTLKRIDLRDEHLHFVSFHSDNGEAVHQIIFSETVVIMNEEQMTRLRG